MQSIEHGGGGGEMFLPQNQFHIISRSTQTNGFSIGFSPQQRLPPFCGCVCVCVCVCVCSRSKGPSHFGNVSQQLDSGQ